MVEELSHLNFQFKEYEVASICVSFDKENGGLIVYHSREFEITYNYVISVELTSN